MNKFSKPLYFINPWIKSKYFISFLIKILMFQIKILRINIIDFLEHKYMYFLHNIKLKKYFY